MGSRSKLNHQGTAGFGHGFHLPGFHFGYPFLTHSHLKYPRHRLPSTRKTNSGRLISGLIGQRPRLFRDKRGKNAEAPRHPELAQTQSRGGGDWAGPPLGKPTADPCLGSSPCRCLGKQTCHHKLKEWLNQTGEDPSHKTQSQLQANVCLPKTTLASRNVRQKILATTDTTPKYMGLANGTTPI